LRFGTARGVNVESAAIRDAQALGRDGLHPDVMGAGRNRALDPGSQQVVEHREYGVLEIDGQGEQPVEEGRDRRQVFPERAVIVRQLQAGRALEGLERAALDLAAVDQEIEL